MNNIVSFLPDMLSGKEIMKAMTVLPNYNSRTLAASSWNPLIYMWGVSKKYGRGCPLPYFFQK